MENKIGYFVTGNATNNDTAVDSILRDLMPKLTAKQRKARRLRCLGHVINLSAKAFLYGNKVDEFIVSADTLRATVETVKELELWRKRGPVGRLHNIIVFICRSPQRIEAFEGLLKEDGTLFEFRLLKLKADNATRWNSLYTMIERALKLRERITRYCEQYENEMHGPKKSSTANLTVAERQQLLKHDKLSGDDWKVLEEIMTILKPFYIYTKRAEGKSTSSDRGIVSEYLVSLNQLLDHVRIHRQKLAKRIIALQLDESSAEILRTCLLNCWVKLDEYFLKVDATPAHYASIVTLPNCKWKYFERAWKGCEDWPDATAPETWLLVAKEALKTLWKDEYSTLLKPTIPAKRARANTIVDIDEALPPSPDRIAIAMNCVGDSDEDIPAITDELELWLSEKRFFHQPNHTLPQYWLSQLSNPDTYRLARMALDMCSIPAMSSECERVFSQAKLLITGQRTRLKADIIEATQCLRMWSIMDRKAAGIWKPGRKKESDGTSVVEDNNPWVWKTPTELYNFYDAEDAVQG